ncbi:MAG TPA: hypothetical protein VH593_34165 [Ktedonobacteraceae bacterium]|jgi:ABC-type transport system involved in multi-copper enzyme maturation permease subunit
MFWNVLLLETDKIFKRALIWIELTILAIVIIGITLIEYFISQLAPLSVSQPLIASFTWPNGLENAAQFAEAHSLGGILLVVLLSMITAQEYSWRTYHLWLGRGTPRPVLLGAKCLAALIAVLFVVVTTVIVSGLTTGVLTLLIKGSLPLQQVNFTHFVSNILIIYYGLLPYLALAFLLSILSRSVAVALSISLTFLLLVEGTVYTALSLMHGLAAQLVQYLPEGLEAAMQPTSQPSTASNVLSVPSPPPLVAVLCIACYVLVFVGVGFWRFFRQNFTD